MANSFFIALKLMRLGNPTGYLLVFFPALFGLILAAKTAADLFYIPLFFVGSVIARGAGCTINDILDKDFDKDVARTKNRVLANDQSTLQTAYIILAILMLLCLLILLSLSKTAIIIGVIGFFMIVLYPLMKRITYFPQVFLGLTFNLGALIGYSTIQNKITLESLLLYTACCFWTISYDTIYAFMDIEDDKKVGIKSLAILLESRNYHFWLSLFYSLFIGLILCLAVGFGSFSPLGIFLIALAALDLAWQIISLDISKPAKCARIFKHNNIVGFFISAAYITNFISNKF